jgi:two-component system, chemotaxis family, CheB/CheR fusion protein
MVVSWPGTQAQRIYGWSEADSLKMNISSVVPEDRKEKEHDMVKKLSRAENMDPYVTQQLSKGGRIINVWLTASSMIDKKGDVYAISTTEREIRNNIMSFYG